MILLRMLNLILLLGLVACLAGAMAGLIVFAPFFGGGWFLTLVGILGSESGSPAPQPRTRPERVAATEPVGPVSNPRARGGREARAPHAQPSVVRADPRSVR